MGAVTPRLASGAPLFFLLRLNGFPAVTKSSRLLRSLRPRSTGNHTRGQANMTVMRTIAAGAAAASLLAGISATAEAQLIKIDGSSTVFPVTEAVAEEFQKAQKGKIRVTVGISGTGGGFKKFCRGETDIQDASRPILKSEMEECRKNNIAYVEMPVAYDALTVVVNPKNAFLRGLTIA